MKKLILFTLLLTSFLFPQLKEMEVKPTTQKGGIPINRDNPDKAAIFFYTQFDDLSFWSNYGIVDIKGDPAGGKYIVIVEPVRQTIEVRRKGFKTEMIKIESLQPRDVLYYEVLPKDQGMAGVTEVGITVQVSPSDASISLDGSPFPNNVTTKVTLGNHNLRVEKAGYGSTVQEIVVTPEKTFFQINLEKVSLSPVTIKSNPSNGTVYINNEQKGVTEVGFFLYSGSYELRIELIDYAPVIDTILISPTTDKSKNAFSYNLLKNKGTLELSVTPTNAIVNLNNEQRNISGSLELNPGLYNLEVRANQYDTYREQIEIKRGDTLKKVVNLTKNTGVMELTVEPSFAVVTINQEQKSGNRFELNPGLYNLEVRANQYDTYKEQIEIKRGETLKKVVNLTKNTGVLDLKVQPAIAAVSINKEKKSGNRFELIPGVYEIEIAAETFYPEIFTVTIEKGKTTERSVTLKQKTGTLQFTIKPLNAKVVLNQNGIEKYSWEGINIIESILEGEYDLIAKAPEYKSYTNKVTVKEGQTTIEDIQMTPESDVSVKEGQTRVEDIQMTLESDVSEGMVLIEGGTFSMGSKEGDTDENPVHEVTVDSFYIGKTEVTQELWQSIMGINPSNFKGSKRPVEKVSWYDVVQFCNNLSETEGLQNAYLGRKDSIICDFNSNGYRLPTGAEWEFAARGGNQSKGYKYSGSNIIDEVAWYKSNSGGETHDVGEKSQNELGLYDMSGNVWEWCWDWIGDYPSFSQTNPQGPSFGSLREGRGGGWSGGAGYCRVFDRHGGTPVSKGSDLGFRVVRTTKIIPPQKTGKLQFSINPSQAECVLSQNDIEKYIWSGRKLFNAIPEGSYDLTAKAKRYKTYTKKVTIKKNQTTIEDIQMTIDNDLPEGFVLVEGGTFSMGSDDGRSDERPIHLTSVSGFYIGKTEVTQGLWESVMGINPSGFEGAKRPVETVNWNDVVEFCNKLSEMEGLQKAYSGSGENITCDFNSEGYRLPTEAEWEYAARGGNQSKGYQYSGSNDIDSVGWYRYETSGLTTHDAGTKSPNELGIYDMTGNIMEWCWDWYGEDYYSSSPGTNPRGPLNGSFRVYRGGSWRGVAESCRVAYRSRNSLGLRSPSLGFRLVRTK